MKRAAVLAAAVSAGTLCIGTLVTRGRKPCFAPPPLQSATAGRGDTARACTARGSSVPCAARVLSDEYVARRLISLLGPASAAQLARTNTRMRAAYGKARFYFHAEQFLSKCKGPKKSKCERCWLLRSHCICKQLAEIESRVSTRHEVLMFIHYREWGLRKASNTARLLPLLLGTEVFTFGKIESEDRLMWRLRRASELRGDPVLVLFPSPDSVTVTEFLSSEESGRARGMCASERKKGAALGMRGREEKERRFVIVVIDGSWKNARRLNAVLPKSYRRVRLSSCSRKAYPNLRKHSMENRVSTMSALLHMLQELEEPQADIDALGQGLSHAATAYYKQSRKPRHKTVNDKPLRFAKDKVAAMAAMELAQKKCVVDARRRAREKSATGAQR